VTTVGRGPVMIPTTGRRPPAHSLAGESSPGRPRKAEFGDRDPTGSNLDLSS